MDAVVAKRQAEAMHVLLTGGTGFIGTALCQRLRNAGHEVTVLSRQPGRVPALCGAGVQGISTLTEIPLSQPVDAVVNLAGASIGKGRWTKNRKRELVESRVRITEQITEFLAARDQKPACLISASAVGFYGAQDDTPLDETAAPHEEFQHDLCASWESAARKAEQLGVRTAIIRLGIVLGPGGGALADMLPPYRFGLGGPISSGQQYMSWVHREDVLRAIEWLLAHPEQHGAFNLTAPNPVPNVVFAQTLGKVLHRPAFLPMPGFVLRILLGEFAHLLITGQRVLPRKLQEGGFTFQFGELEGALEDILKKN